MVCHLNRRVQLFVRTQLIVTGGVVGINRKRVSDFMESPKLFVPPITPDALRQGKISDCWFISALAVLTRRDDGIMQCFLTREYNTYGVYTVQFHKNGIPLLSCYLHCLRRLMIYIILNTRDLPSINVHRSYHKGVDR
jgi:hypothetical protein